MDYINNKEIVNLYKVIWEKHDVISLPSLFHKNICYNDRNKNFFNGLKEVENYWKEISKKQKNVQFNPIEILDKNNQIILYWEASFYHVIKKKEKVLTGIMWLKIKDNKIIELLEYFEKDYK
jgi:hypothetical protein